MWHGFRHASLAKLALIKESAEGQVALYDGYGEGGEAAMQRWYDIYGGIARRFTGSCTVPGKSALLQGTFDCVQMNDGNIVMKVETIGDSDTMQEIAQGYEMAQEPTVSGVTKEGRPFLAKCYATIRRQAQLFGDPGLVFEYGVTEVVVGEEDVAATRFRYGLTNLRW